MSDLTNEAVAEQLDALRARITELEASSVEASSPTPPKGRRPHRITEVRRIALTVGVISVVAAATTGVALASGPSNPGLTYILVSPAGAVASGVSLAAGKAAAYTVSGGTTPVPTDATAVRLSVTVSGADAGTLTSYPNLDSTGGSGQTISWAAGKSVTGTLEENVGAANKVTFKNLSSGTAKLTATVTGYSTQVAATDVNGVGGTTGQVLTNTGSGAAWSTLPLGSATNFSPTGGTTGQFLANTGTGVTWSGLPNASAAKFSPTGGSAGQYLANTGTGVTWSGLPNASAAKFSGTGGNPGQVLTNTGAGASWQNVNTISSPWFTISTGETQQSLDLTNLWTETINVPQLTNQVLTNSSVSVYMQFGGNEVPLPYSASAGGTLFSTVSYQLNVGQILITRATSDNSGSIELPSSLQFRYVITTATGPSAGSSIPKTATKPDPNATSIK